MYQLGFYDGEVRSNLPFLKSAKTVFLLAAGTITFKVSATLKIAIFPYLRFQSFQIGMLESFLLKKKSENIISVERYRG